MGLLAAIFTGREVKARELLALPWTNINAQYANGNTPLILAVQGKILFFKIPNSRIPIRYTNMRHMGLISMGAAGAFAPAEIWQRVQCTRH